MSICVCVCVWVLVWACPSKCPLPFPFPPPPLSISAYVHWMVGIKWKIQGITSWRSVGQLPFNWFCLKLCQSQKARVPRKKIRYAHSHKFPAPLIFLLRPLLWWVCMYICSVCMVRFMLVWLLHYTIHYLYIYILYIHIYIYDEYIYMMYIYMYLYIYNFVYIRGCICNLYLYCKCICGLADVTHTHIYKRTCSYMGLCWHVAFFIFINFLSLLFSSG